MRNIFYLLSILFIASFVFSCTKEDDDDGGEKETPWDKNRTASILVVTGFTDNLLTGNVIQAVAGAIKESVHNVAILHNTNVYTGQEGMRNPGAEVALLSAKVPVFNPAGKMNDTYVGNTVLFNHTISSLEQYPIRQNCWVLQTENGFTSALKMDFTTVSFIEQSQLDAGVEIIGNGMKNSTLVTGFIKKELVSALESSLATGLTKGNYILEFIEESGKEYDIYVLGSSQWKFREVTEQTITGTIKSFLLQVEYLK